MKHLLSFVAALAATAALTLTSGGMATAQNTASSGPFTCTGTNADGTTATWSLGGAVVYTVDYGNPYSHFPNYLNYRPRGDNNACGFTLDTSSDIGFNCAGLSGDIYMHYVVYPGYGGTQQIAHYTTGETLLPNHDYSRHDFTFSNVLDANSVQYKVTSLQAGSMTEWVAATSYL